MSAQAKIILPLLSKAISLAKKNLDDTQVCYPFGVMMNFAHEIHAVQKPFQKNPDLQACFEFSQRHITSVVSTQKAIAVAIATDWSNPQTDSSPYDSAVRILIEASEYARCYFLPYRYVKGATDVDSLQGAGIEYGTPFWLIVEPTYFLPIWIHEIDTKIQ